MLEMKLTIEAPELANALNNLAAALGARPFPTAQQAPAAASTQPQPVVPQQAPAAPVQQPMPAPATTAQPNTPVAGVPLAQPPKYTVDQIMAAGAQLMDAGKVNDLMNLLHSFGVQAVMDLKPEQLGAFATALRDMGAKI
jgi:hypothetical protein